MDNTSIILELLARIQKLEQQVLALQSTLSTLQSSNTAATKEPNDFAMSIKAREHSEEVRRRDTTKYLFNGIVYSKNRLVLAIVQDYVKNNPISFDELSATVHPSLQGSIGVVERAEVAKKRSDYQVRYFTEKNEILTLTDGQACVCNQWGILNIPRFVQRAKELGYDIQEIKR